MDHSMDLRTKPEEEDEPPLLNDSVMPYMTPSHFLTWMRWKLETPAWVLETYEALVLHRAQWDRPENRPYYENMVARFVNHSDWVFMRPALEKKEIIPQAIVPHSTPGYDPAFYEHEKKTFLLPAVDLKQFNLWGLDPERFIKDMLSTNPGRIKELSKAQIVHAAGKFAELRFPGAHLGLNKLFKKQFETILGLAALAKHDEERRAIIFEDGFFECTAGTDPAAMKNELQRQRSGMFGRARRSEKEISQAEVKRIKKLAQGIPKQDLYQPGIATTDRSLQLLRAHPLPEPQRTSLASSSMALIVFLPSLEEQAASVAVTHFHILPTEREHELKWVKLELLPAFHPAVVIPFENGSVKDRALAQLQYSYRFNFLEEKGVQLNACTLREDVAQEPTFKLGSMPLKNLALFDESLRAFFWYKGYISNRDLITEQVRGLNKSKAVVRNNRCYAWVQKCTVIKAGNKDQEIPAEPVQMCSICGPSQSRPLPVVDSAAPNSPEIPRQIPKFPDHLRSEPKSAPMSRDKTKTCSVASPPALFSSLLSKNDTKVPGHAPEKKCPATASGIQPIMPAFYVTNHGRGHISSPKNHRQVRSQNTYETPTRSGTAVTDGRAPNRKRVFSPDAPELYQRRSRLQAR